MDTGTGAQDNLNSLVEQEEFQTNHANENYMFDTGQQNNRLLGSDTYSTSVKNEVNKTYATNDILTPSRNNEPHFSTKQSRFGGPATAISSNAKSVGNDKHPKDTRMSIDTNDGSKLADGLMINSTSNEYAIGVDSVKSKDKNSRNAK